MNTKFLVISMIVLLIVRIVPLATVTTAQDISILPLSERGTYVVGERIIDFVDTSRDSRPIVIKVWYPAIIPEGSDVDISALQDANRGLRDAPPATTDAPYPLILVSHGKGSYYELPQFTVSLASQGFVVVSINHRGDEQEQSVINRPMDILFVLDQLAAITEGDLAGFIDTDHVGVMGWSFGAYTALAVSGAQIDPPVC